MSKVLLVMLAGCSGFIGDPGCPDAPTVVIELDEPVRFLQRAVEDLPVFAASPVRASLLTGTGTTGLSIRIDPVEAISRQARNPDPDPLEPRCEEVLATYRIELFTDDGSLEWSAESSMVVEEVQDAELISLSVPFAANLGDAEPLVDFVREEILAAHPDLAPESVVPVAYELELDLSARAPRGSITLVVRHDPVPETVTEWVVGTF